MELPIYRYAVLLLRSIYRGLEKATVAWWTKNITCQDGGKNFEIGWVLSALNLIKRAPALYYFHSIAPDRFLENATRNWIAKLDANREDSCRSFFPVRVLYTYLSVICSYATNARIQAISEQRASQILFQDVSFDPIHGSALLFHVSMGYTTHNLGAFFRLYGIMD